MIVSAALVPGPPLLAPALGQFDPVVVAVRDACVAAVVQLLAAEPGLVVVVGTGPDDAQWPADAQLDLAAYGAPAPPPALVAPRPLGVGGLLLDLAGHTGPRHLQTVAVDSTLDACRTVAARLAEPWQRVGLLVVADGTAKRTVKAPGHFDDRAAGYDEAVRVALAAGEPTALHDLDPVLATTLMAIDWAALQVLAFAAPVGPWTIHYADAPFGVGYLAASRRAAP